MRKRIHKILVTGGAGFIGSAFVRLLRNRDCPRQCSKRVINRGLSLNKVVVVDKLTYAGDLKRLKEVEGKYKFYKSDICDKKKVEMIFQKENPDVIIHFAAETHVDRSIADSDCFIKTNIIGTKLLLDLARKYKIKKFIHISTDEVYGDIRRGSFNEDSPLMPNSPYAASKAAADLLIRSYIRTYSFPAIIIRPCNNYGPWQYPEKLIPVAISRAAKGKKIPIYAQGNNVREWLYVEDCARAILAILKKGKIGEAYNLGSGQEMRNIDVACLILKYMGKSVNFIEFVKDRPGHDVRYSLDFSKLRRETGWCPEVPFARGLEQTVNWYLK